MAKIDHTQLTIAAASVAAELHHAEQTARRLTISAKNAAAIVLRAGSQAAGLSVISSFYDELANKTISLARVINATAVELSSLTVYEWRTSAAITHITKAYQCAEDAPYRESIKPFLSNVNSLLTETSKRFQTLLKDLNEKLEEVQRHMRAIDVIAVTSRLEAQRTGEFRDGLMQMATDIQAQANEIKGHVARSTVLLNHC